MRGILCHRSAGETGLPSPDDDRPRRGTKRALWWLAGRDPRGVREDRHRYAANVIGRVPAEEAGYFCLFLAIYINGAHEAIRRQAREVAQFRREYEERKREYEITEGQFRQHVARDMQETLQRSPDLEAAYQHIEEQTSTSPSWRS